MTIKLNYGLELTNNSKVGWAFSLPRTKTCINATAICRKLCYGNGIRYQSASPKDKRERNYMTAEFLLLHGGPTLLAENLLMMVDLARPRDWLTAKITNTTTVVPWTLRIHDIGISIQLITSMPGFRSFKIDQNARSGFTREVLSIKRCSPL